MKSNEFPDYQKLEPGQWAIQWVSGQRLGQPGRPTRKEDGWVRKHQFPLEKQTQNTAGSLEFPVSSILVSEHLEQGFFRHRMVPGALSLLKPVSQFFSLLPSRSFSHSGFLIEKGSILVCNLGHLWPWRNPPASTSQCWACWQEPVCLPFQPKF